MPVKATSKILKTNSDRGEEGKEDAGNKGRRKRGQNKLAGEENEEVKYTRRG